MWIAIVGSWRHVSCQIEQAVRDDVKKILSEGNGIVSGGALGVDYIGVDEALRLNPSADRVKVILPTDLSNYSAYFNIRAKQGIVAVERVDKLMEQFRTIQSQNPDNLIELPEKKVFWRSFHARNLEVIRLCDAVHAYQINNSNGTQNTIDVAREANKPVSLFSYTIKN